MDSHKRKVAQRKRRHRRVRRKVLGTAERPRLVLFRSLKNVYAQLIDDTAGKTLASASSQAPEVREQLSYGGNRKAAEAVGELLGKRLREAGIAKIVFDRAGYKYHGRVKALADGVRKAGLKF